MRRNRLSFQWIAILMLFPILLVGQPGKYIIKNYDLMEVLSLNGSIWTAVQDTNGTMFFGFDDGIVSYDGSFWSIVSENLGTVRVLMRSRANQLYYGSLNDFGLIRHNVKNGYYTQSLLTGYSDSIKNFGDIWSISESGRKVFFQATRKIFVLENGQIRSFDVSDTYHRGFAANDKFFINQKGIGLCVFSEGSFTPVAGGSFFVNMTISNALSLKNNELLICTRTHGVFQFNPATGEVKHPFSDFAETESFLKKNNLYHVIMLPNANIAFSTLYGGTIIVAEDGRIINRLNRNQGLHDNVHYFLYFTDDLNLWMCTSNGISTWNINSLFVYWDYTTGIDGVVLDIEKGQNKIYVASLTGLYSINTDFDKYLLAGGVAEHILDSEVWNLTQANFNNGKMLLLGTGKGLFALQESKIMKIWESDLVLKVLQLKNNSEIILSFRGNAIDVFKWNSTSLQFQHTLSGMFTGLRSVAEDNRGYIWVGTRTPELVKIPLELITHEKESINEVQRYSPKMQLTDVFAYGDEVAFSNYSGLLSYVEETDSFVPCYLFGNEIAKIPKMFSSLEKDYQNNVWVGGNEVFLFHSDGTYTLEKLSFHQFEEVFSAFVFFHENEQRTWIGGNNGLFLLRKEPQMMYPEKVQAVISKVNISRDLLDLHINSIQWPGGNSGDETPDYPLRIDLTRNNSQVTFYFSLPYFNNENKTQFSYRLKNYSETWTNWSNEHFATYSNLPSGNYTFEVRALTINKQTSKEASIQIHVPTPWYVTNYAILFYLLFVAGLIYFIAAVISKQRIRKQLRIEDVIRKRMQENKITAIVQTVGKSTDTKPEDRSPEYVGKPIKPTDSKQRQEVFLEKSLEIIENHIGDPDFGVESFCEKMNMNQAFLYRKILAVTGMSINSFIRNTRLKKAAQLLLETDLTISEVAYQTGFSTPSYFTRCFKNEFGKSPRDFVQSQHKTLKP